MLLRVFCPSHDWMRVPSRLGSAPLIFCYLPSTEERTQHIVGTQQILVGWSAGSVTALKMCWSSEGQWILCRALYCLEVYRWSNTFPYSHCKASVDFFLRNYKKRMTCIKDLLLFSEPVLNFTFISLQSHIRIKLKGSSFSKRQFPLMADHELTHIPVSFRQIILATKQITNKSKHRIFASEFIGRLWYLGAL